MAETRRDPSARPTADDPAAPDLTTLGPADSLALIAEQRARVEAWVDVDARVVLGVWGVAWLLGFGLLWLAMGEAPVLDLAAPVTWSVFGGLLALASAITIWQTTRSSAGVTGASATQGAMYGWSWFLAFAGIGGLGYALGRTDTHPDVQMLVMTAAAALIVGALYMAGGAVWRDRVQFTLGAWICLATTVGVVVGTPHMLLVMALAGGGGMLVAAGVLGRHRARAGDVGR